MLGGIVTLVSGFLDVKAPPNALRTGTPSPVPTTSRVSAYAAGANTKTHDKARTGIFMRSSLRIFMPRPKVAHRQSDYPNEADSLDGTNPNIRLIGGKVISKGSLFLNKSMK